MLHMSAQCYEHRFGYCTNAKTCFNVHIAAILAERRVLLGSDVRRIFSLKLDRLTLVNLSSFSENVFFRQSEITRFNVDFASKVRRSLTSGTTLHTAMCNKRRAVKIY